MAVQALQVTANNTDIHQQTYNALQRVIDDRDLRVYVQTIVSLDDLRPFGFEALTRGPVNSQFETAWELFSTASKYGLTDELEYAALTSALYVEHTLPENTFLAINVGPNLFLTKDFLEIANLCSGIAKHIVFELTEHVPFTDLAQLQIRIETLKSMGYRIALDDTGCGFANIELARKLQPNIVKLCIEVVKRLTHDEAERARFSVIAKELTDSGVTLLGEGIESEKQLEILKTFGVELGQGDLFGTPYLVTEHY